MMRDQFKPRLYTVIAIIAIFSMVFMPFSAVFAVPVVSCDSVSCNMENTDLTIGNHCTEYEVADLCSPSIHRHGLQEDTRCCCLLLELNLGGAALCLPSASETFIQVEMPVGVCEKQFNPKDICDYILKPPQM